MEILRDMGAMGIGTLEIGCNCGCAKVNCSGCTKTGCDCGCAYLNCGS